MAETRGLSEADRSHLERARRIARRGWGSTHPNPMVGCVLVRGGDVVGEGWHAEFGGPHAEVVALESAGERARGATAYVSLEPCAHHGKTPPCTEALLAAGVSRVVYGARDPGPESGGGGRALAAAGLDVSGPAWTEAVARAENPAFHHAAESDTPYLALKLAMSLDGKIAEARGRRTRITGAEADREVHRLRAGFDGILIGSGTAAADDPRLTVRLAEPGRRQPLRLVLDSTLRLSPGAALFEDVDAAPVHVFTGCDAPAEAVAELEAAGARIHRVGEAEEGLDLGRVWAVCMELGVRSILCEGGARVAASLLAEDRVQRLYLFVAPRALGPDGVPAFGGAAEAVGLERFRPVLEPEVHGADVLLVYDRARG